jgi:hypothetical protein
VFMVFAASPCRVAEQRPKQQPEHAVQGVVLLVQSLPGLPAVYSECPTSASANLRSSTSASASTL